MNISVFFVVDPPHHPLSKFPRFVDFLCNVTPNYSLMFFLNHSKNNAAGNGNILYLGAVLLDMSLAGICKTDNPGVPFIFLIGQGK